MKGMPKAWLDIHSQSFVHHRFVDSLMYELSTSETVKRSHDG